MGLYSDSSAICKQGRGNDCVHTCNLRLGFGNLSLPERGTASTAEEAGKEGWGELTAFPPSICHPLPLFLPAHLCLSFSLKLSFCEGSVSSMCPHTTCNSQSRSLVLRPLVYFKPAEGRRVSFIFLCVSSSLSADTPIQMISRHFLPREVLRLPVSPKPRQSAFSHLLECQPTLPFVVSFVLLFPYFFILTLAPKFSHIQLICKSK